MPRPHESARPCGCDPGARYICERHGTVRDQSESEVEGAYVVDPRMPSRREPLIVVVTGPDQDGDFALMGAGGEWTYLPRFVCEDLIRELQRRLDLKG